MRQIATLAALAAVVGLVFGVTPASAHRGAPYKTDAWAKRTLQQRVHYWRGFRIDPDWMSCYGDGSFLNPRYNRNGEQIFSHFNCTMDSVTDANYNSRHFYVTLHTIRYRPYFRLTVGWR